MARAATRELVSVFDEATSFFGIWARQGSRLNVERHQPSAEAAAVGAERFASKLRVAEKMIVGPYLTGPDPSMADLVAYPAEELRLAHGLPEQTGIVL